MTTLEAIAILSNLKAGLKPKEAVAVLKGIQALTEKAQREQKAKVLKEENKHLCIDCKHYYFDRELGLGKCEVKDGAFDCSRLPTNRACKNFISIKEVIDNEN